jgi:hypothetical protein
MGLESISLGDDDLATRSGIGSVNAATLIAYHNEGSSGNRVGDFEGS